MAATISAMNLFMSVILLAAILVSDCTKSISAAIFPQLAPFYASGINLQRPATGSSKEHINQNSPDGIHKQRIDPNPAQHGGEAYEGEPDEGGVVISLHLVH